MGTKPAAALLAGFDGLGVGFEGPQGTATGTAIRPTTASPSVPNHIVQIVNSRMAIFTKKGTKFDTTGKPLYGPVATNTVFKGFAGNCEERQSGDAVVRYDQLADRWLFVLPLFSRGPVRPDQVETSRVGDPAQVMVIGRSSQPGAAMPLFVPPPPPPPPPTPPAAPGAPGQPPARGAGAPRRSGPSRTAGGPARSVLDVLRDQHVIRSDGLVLPLRIPAAALPGLPAAGDLAGRLLHADEHRRQPDLGDRRDAEARVRRRSREDAQGRAGHRAVRDHRERQLPQQCGHRRQSAAARRARRTS